MKTIWMSTVDNSGTVISPVKPETVRQAAPPPARYEVSFKYDAYTSPDFVKLALVCHFNKSSDDAARLAYFFKDGENVVAGIFSKDEAETRKAQTTQCAQQREYPLLVEIKPVYR